MKTGLLLWFVLLAGCVIAQPYSSTPSGTFTLNQIKGCAPLTVTLTAPTCDGSVGCDVDYLGNNSFRSVVLTDSFTFTNPGTYTVRLVRGVIVDQIQVVVVANTLPSFQVFSCSGNKITVRTTDLTYDRYNFTFSDGASFTSPRANPLIVDHVFASPGAKSVTVRGINNGAADNCNTSTANINALATLPVPTINRLTVLNGSDIRLDYTNDVNIQYRLEIATNNASTFQTARVFSNRTSDTIRSLRTDDNYYCFRLGVQDICNNTINYSQTICSSNLDVAALNNINRATWTTGPGTGFTNYTVSATSPLGTSNSITTTTTFDDTNIVCGTNYCYQVTTNYSNGSQSISLSKCVTAISTDAPIPVTDIASIVAPGSVVLSWYTDPSFTPDVYSVFKSEGSGYRLLQETNLTEITDASFSTEAITCYQISYRDVCNNVSARSREACPVLLRGSLSGSNVVSLSWTAYDGYRNGVREYIITKKNVNGDVIETINASTATTYSDATENLANQVYFYVVTAVPNEAGLESSVSNEIQIIKNPNIFYPTAFTPNGDNLNDVFNVFGQYISEFELSIFNRWGELIFSTASIAEGWDGSFRGSPMPEGTYTFVADITDLAGRKVKRSGSVLLLRKRR